MTVFISRSLLEAPVFVQLLQAYGHIVQGSPLIILAPLPPRQLPAFDWVFFSSKNAVHYLLDVQPQSTFENDRVRIAALGSATATALHRYFDPIDFIGTGDPVSTAVLFQKLIGTTYPVVLFPGARNSQQSVQLLLGDAVAGIHWEVYDNQPVAAVPAISAVVLVFTSPMNAQAYFKHHVLATGQRVVAIGNTTAQALQNLGITEVIIAVEPTETGLAQAVLHLLS